MYRKGRWPKPNRALGNLGRSGEKDLDFQRVVVVVVVKRQCGLTQRRYSCGCYAAMAWSSF
jgi:hypothetical protein